ncbi:hypothetical protein [uncultured Hymenobacter sp.]|uniref:hypothetical protein n=1 Tax=uncultured Hymenobacter sp. TaxID=170016 RepID=UPI0035CBCB0F
MSNVQIQKIKVIIEVELREHVPSIPVLPASDADVKGHEYEQALFAALRADPERYAEFVRTLILTSVEAYGLNRMLPELAQINDTYTASLEVLESLLPRFSQPAQLYLQEGIDKGWITEGKDSLFNTIEATPVLLTVEYPSKAS